MKLKLLIVVGLLSALIAAVAMMPASVMENRINHHLQANGLNLGQFRVNGGTIWSGSGALTIGATNNVNNTSGSRASPLTVGLQWSFVPTELLGLRMAFDVIADGKALRGNIRVGGGFGSVAISRVDVASSLEVIARFNSNLALLRAAGDIVLRSNDDTLVISYATSVNASGRLRVITRDVRLRSIGNEPFGSYEASLVFDKQTIRYQIDKASGMLTLKGDGAVVWSSPRQFRYTGAAAASRAAPYWLPATLLLVGRPTLDGRFNIDYKTGF